MNNLFMALAAVAICVTYYTAVTASYDLGQKNCPKCVKEAKK